MDSSVLSASGSTGKFSEDETSKTHDELHSGKRKLDTSHNEEPAQKKRVDDADVSSTDKDMDRRNETGVDNQKPHERELENKDAASEKEETASNIPTKEGQTEESAQVKDPANKKSIANMAEATKLRQDADFYRLLKSHVLTERQLVQNGYPRPSKLSPDGAVMELEENRKCYTHSHTGANREYCERCRTIFSPTTNDQCRWHWGKCYGRPATYKCCDRARHSQGCEVSSQHVFKSNLFEDLSGYVNTSSGLPAEGDIGVFSLDTESVYTTGGREVARVSLLTPDLKVIYDKLVKPPNPVIDYNTRFSGLTEKDLTGITASLRDVHTELLELIGPNTILIGHSLESDFASLKLIHGTVVDTSIAFPHPKGWPFKHSLKNLAEERLNRYIQSRVGGHDSHEDATACMELMMRKVGYSRPH